MPNAAPCRGCLSSLPKIWLGIAATPTAAEKDAVRDGDGDIFSAAVPVPESQYGCDSKGTSQKA